MQTYTYWTTRRSFSLCSSRSCSSGAVSSLVVQYRSLSGRSQSGPLKRSSAASHMARASITDQMLNRYGYGHRRRREPRLGWPPPASGALHDQTQPEAESEEGDEATQHRHMGHQVQEDETDKQCSEYRQRLIAAHQARH